MKLIDIETERKAKKKRERKKRKDDMIGTACRISDRDGDYYRFSVTYIFRGKNWTFDMWAKSKKEAMLRVDSIKRFPVDVTQILEVIPQ